jgi:hypothetical protein
MSFNYPNFCRRRRRRNYKDKLIGGRLASYWLRNYSRREMMAAAQRFAKDGETRNAVEIMRLAYYPEQLNITFRPGRDMEAA